MFALKDVTVNPLFPKLMATSSMDKTIKIWESQSLTLRKVVDRSRYNGHLNSVNSLLWLEDADNTLISAGDDKLIMAWKLENLCEVP
jgi:WD40 repeat protein